MSDIPEREDRECGCPPWVDRCVHFDGKQLILGKAKGCDCGLPPIGSRHGTGDFAVTLVPFPLVDCPLGKGIGTHLAAMPSEEIEVFMFPTGDEARAEFDRRAELLRAP